MQQVHAVLFSHAMDVWAACGGVQCYRKFEGKWRREVAAFRKSLHRRNIHFFDGDATGVG